MKWRACFCVSLLACLALAADLHAVPKNVTVLGRAGEITVEQEEFKAFMKLDLGAAAGVKSLEQKESSLKKLLLRKAMAADAVAKGWEKDPEVKRSLLQWKLENYPDYYWRTQVAEKIEVTDKDLKVFAAPQEKFLLSAILLNDDEEGEEEARTIHDKLTAGADFQAMAKQYSRGITASAGGDAGWQEPPNMMIDAHIADTLRNTPKGGITQPLKTGAGLVIFKVRDHQSVEAAFQAQKEKLSSTVRGSKFNEAKARRMQELRDKAKIVYPAQVKGSTRQAPGKQPPLVVVDGYAVMPEALGQDNRQHGFTLPDVNTPQQRLEKFIEAFLVVREMEKLGLDKQPEIARRYQLAWVTILSSTDTNRAVKDQVSVTEAEIKAEYARYYVPDIYDLRVILTLSREKAEEAYKQLKGGKTSKRSADDTATGG